MLHPMALNLIRTLNPYRTLVGTLVGSLAEPFKEAVKDPKHRYMSLRVRKFKVRFSGFWHGVGGLGFIIRVLGFLGLG